MRFIRSACPLLVLVAFLATFQNALADKVDTTTLLAKLRAIGPKGAGHREAIAAWKELSTAEAEQLWQIGVDVAEEHRARGIGAALTAVIAAHTLAAGKAPWYGVLPVNLPSIGAALAAGFRPAWVEAYTAAGQPHA